MDELEHKCLVLVQKVITELPQIGEFDIESERYDMLRTLL